MLDFVMRLAGVSLELGRLLRIRFVPDSPSNETPVGRALASVLELHNEGKHDRRDFELLRLSFLIKHLKEIEEADPELLKHFRREVWRAGATDSFYGIRFEVNIAASLIRKEVNFEKTESPDFRLQRPHSGLAIECTGLHVRDPQRRSDPFAKIERCIREKAEKPYAAPSVALFVDVTNLYFARSQANIGYPDPDQLRELARATLGESSFGSALFFFYIVNRKNGGIQSSYVRADSPSPSPDLRTFLSEHFPINGFELTEFSLPREG